MEDKTKQICDLIDRAAIAKTADDALKFSQAACNAANAMVAMKNARHAG